MTTPSLAHSHLEDAVAILMGTLFIALGLAILKAAGLGIGGIAGLAFLATQIWGLSFGLVFFVGNLPFFVFGYLVFGRAYLLRTIAASALLSLESTFLPPLLSIGHAEPPVAAVVGGFLVGMGILALIRHRTGIGGIGILAVYLQDRLGWPAGKVQMGADALVVAAALAVMAPVAVGWSIVGAVAMSLVLVLNHKPGRYGGF